MKYLIYFLLITNIIFADYQPITSDICPSSSVEFADSLTPAKISNDYYNICLSSDDCEELSEFYGEVITKEIDVLDMNQETDVPEAVEEKLTSLRTLTIAGKEINVKDVEFDDATLQCVYEGNQLMTVNLHLQKGSDLYNLSKNSKLSNSTVGEISTSNIIQDGHFILSANINGSVELTYLQGLIKIQLISNDFTNESKLTFNSDTLESSTPLKQESKVESSFQLNVIENGIRKHQYSFNLSDSSSCGNEGEDSCIDEQIQNCYGPFDLKNGSQIIGDIKICNTGTVIRKNVLSSDGSFVKEVITNTKD